MNMHHGPIIKVLVRACVCFYMAYHGSCFTSNKGMTTVVTTMMLKMILRVHNLNVTSH